MFKSRLTVVATDTKWILDEPLVYETQRGETVVVPVGFPTDLASIPRLARPLYPVHGKHTRAAVVHDYLYFRQKIDGGRIDRGLADKIFYEAMLELKVRPTKAYLMYLAVRSGGWITWRRYAKRQT